MSVILATASGCQAVHMYYRPASVRLFQRVILYCDEIAQIAVPFLYSSFPKFIKVSQGCSKFLNCSQVFVLSNNFEFKPCSQSNTFSKWPRWPLVFVLLNFPLPSILYFARIIGHCCTGLAVGRYCLIFRSLVCDTSLFHINYCMFLILKTKYRLDVES